MQEITIVAAIFAGILSFLSPCVLPLVPAYISFMSGVSIDQLRQNANRQQILRKTIFTSLAFISGFSVIFVLLGATATTLGAFLRKTSYSITPVAGVIIIIFGLHFLGVFKKTLQFLNYEKRFHVGNIQAGIVSAFVVGLAFAFGWTPCTGPFLGSIFFLAERQQTVWQGILLLSAYSLGLGIPFLLTAIAMQKFLAVLNLVKRHFRTMEIISGLFLLTIGVLMLTGRFSMIASKLVNWFPWLMKLA